MDALCGEFDVAFAGKKIGGTVIRREGLFYTVEAECENISSDIMGLFLSDGTRKARIGTMMPENGKLRFRRRFSVTAMAELNLDSVTGCTIASGNTQDEYVTGDEWTPEPEPWKLFSDATASESCKGVTGAMKKREKDGATRLAVPLEFGKPFLPMAIFTLGSWTKIGGKGYIVFSIREGRPVI